MQSTRLPLCVAGFALVLALVAVACGGSSAVSLASPTGIGAGSGGSSISGLVRGGASSSTAGAGTFSMFANRTITVTVNGTTISSPVDGSGQFTLTDVPPGLVTLTFTGPGVNATVTMNVAPDEDVKITVTISGSRAHLDSEEHHAHAGDRGNGPEVEGPLSGLDASARTFTVRTQLVHVPTTATIRGGGTTLTFADLKNGDDVEVRGTMSGTTLEASDVKIDDDADRPDGDAEPGDTDKD